MIRKIFEIVGAIYIILAVLGSIDVIDFHNCISNAGKCRVNVEKEAK
ncbi:hypothetical protein [Burkholderia multivorans]|nr:hypothetical protein [Burkholderia multivorans]MBU9211866.1 hypothetical protein [Burkholderia multivorans]MDN8057090.1 hypothetical protein [Burkholderia multivorans]HDR9834242.1 hypothetical protein [Burkholderia multivorans]HDR9840127.1 hypothetical protein [Burkholderia multivorans]HDR9846715.1 hypothetical protein [Burkholderia multivorans]